MDRLVYYAGWSDKFAQVLGNTNPVSGPFFNFTLPEPMGVVGVITDETAPPLLGLISQIAPAIVSGNTVVAFASEVAPLPAILLGEMLAVSDLPARGYQPVDGPARGTICRRLPRMRPFVPWTRRASRMMNAKRSVSARQSPSSD